MRNYLKNLVPKKSFILTKCSKRVEIKRNTWIGREPDIKRPVGQLSFSYQFLVRHPYVGARTGVF